MLTHTLISAGVVALLTGYAVAQPRDASPREPAEPKYYFIGCPDDCTHSNGTGVYFAESGYAGMGRSQLMITHFVNSPAAQVAFQGHYFNAGTKLWDIYQRDIDTADYQQQKGLLVTSVSETSTVPTWRLFDPMTHATIIVTEQQLSDLKLHIRMPTNEAVVISFDRGSGIQASPAKPTIRRYNMFWRQETSVSPPTAYCIDASHHADQVVFQQGIDVDPVTGSVKRSNGSSFVTMSCYLGALAKVHGWGYAYQATPAAPHGIAVPLVLRDPTFYFDAGIQMKRASYCADSHFYTHAGTRIEIADDRAINHDPASNLEAVWTPNGALCLNRQNMRHGSMGFNGTCSGNQLPPCSSLSAYRKFGYLADGPWGQPKITTAAQPWSFP